MLLKEKKNLKEKVLAGIKKFNEIRAPEAVAELIELKDKKFSIKFSGHMCFTCGTYDYFEDLVFELKEIGLKTKIKNYQNFGNYFLVDYEILNKNFNEVLKVEKNKNII